MNILVQESNNKFINNISITQLDNTSIIKSNVYNNLYELHYTYNIDAIVFTESLLNNEIYQYIAEFFQEIKIFIYHDRLPNNDIIDSYKNTCTHLVDKIYHKTPNTQIIPTLVNSDLYIGIKQNISSNKTHDIVCFIDSVDSLPKKLQSFLYPNSKLKIKLFNNSKIAHPQNIGILDEVTKAKILLEAEYFIALNDEYIPEALLSGCSVITIDELDNLKPTKYIKIPEYSTYKTFLQSIL